MFKHPKESAFLRSIEEHSPSIKLLHLYCFAKHSVEDIENVTGGLDHRRRYGCENIIQSSL